MLTARDLSGMIYDVFRLHDQFPKKPEKAFRKFDGCTPYAVHPTLLAMLLLHEESLPEDVRVIGAKALLAHDLIEDTKAELPAWCLEPRVKVLVDELTFTEQEDPFVEIWKRSDNAILLKFYDNVANLMCTGKMNPMRMLHRKDRVIQHLNWIVLLYPKLEIVKIAKGLLEL